MRFILFQRLSLFCVAVLGWSSVALGQSASQSPSILVSFDRASLTYKYYSVAHPNSEAVKLFVELRNVLGDPYGTERAFARFDTKKIVSGIHKDVPVPGNIKLNQGEWVQFRKQAELGMMLSPSSNLNREQEKELERNTILGVLGRHKIGIPANTQVEGISVLLQDSRGMTFFILTRPIQSSTESKE